MSEWVDVRIQEAGNKLAFRYNPIEDVAEVSIRGRIYEVDMSTYRYVHEKRENSLTFNAEGARIDTGNSSEPS